MFYPGSSRCAITIDIKYENESAWLIENVWDDEQTKREFKDEQRGIATAPGFTEIQMTSESTYHFVSEVPGKPNALVVLVTSRQANLGMGWAGLRNALPEIAPHCP